MSTFTVSGQHYLFNVQTFAHVVLSLGGDRYQYAFRDRSTYDVIEDVASEESELGVLLETSETASDLERTFEEAGLSFTELIKSTPRVALPKSHPLVNADILTLDQLDEYPYIYFEQEKDAPLYFAEEALAGADHPKSISATDRASLSELIVALNGYTITSGILVGITDGSLLSTVALDTDVTLHLGYVARKGEDLSAIGKLYVEKLSENLKKYAKF
ncbi:MAG: LysR substrate-binding domain-containing protein [Eggerthellaceae bacterium]|jgi:DNA-binding transcriptional LysR family regulator